MKTNNHSQAKIQPASLEIKAAGLIHRTLLVACIICLLPVVSRAQQLVGWGDNHSGQLIVPTGLGNVVALAVGGDFTDYFFSLALTSEGRVIGWGDNRLGQIAIPEGLSNVIAIAAGAYHSLALKNDGTVQGWGYNREGQIDIPIGLSNVVAIAAGGCHNLALTADGQVVGWGFNEYGQIDVPAGLSNVVAIAAGGRGDLGLTIGHSLALAADGRVVAWGVYYATNVPGSLSKVVAIAAGSGHSLALTANGKVVGWGENWWGQTSVPSGLSNVVAVAGGGNHSLALTAEGHVVAWGDNYYGTTNVPAGLSNVLAIAAGLTHDLALLSEGGVARIIQQPRDQAIRAERTVAFRVVAAGASPLAYQWRVNGTNLTDGGRIQGAFGPDLLLTDLQAGDAGSYSVVVSNAVGVSTSKVAILTVLPPNHAPVLQDGVEAWLPAIRENAVDNWGTTVEGFLESLGTNVVSDADSDVVGLAITSVNEANGVWQFLLPDEYIWENIGSVQQSAARLLGPQAQLRFVPSPDFFGVVSPGLWFRAWDGTAGIAGEFANTSPNGGTSAFSAGSGTASIIVTAFAPPANDNFDDRISLSGAVLTTWGSTVGATTEPGEPSHTNYYAPGKSAWWAWSPPTNGIYIIEAAGDNLFGAVLYGVVAAYTGSGISNLVCLAEDSLDGPANNGMLCIEALAGTEYLIVVDADNWPGPLPPGSENLRLEIRPGDPAPALIWEPADQTVFVGESIYLSAKAVGLAPLTYQWQRDGTDIAGATNSYFWSGSALLEDGGLYRVVVTNQNGSAASRAAIITVLPRPNQPVLLSPREGDDGLFQFEVYSPTDADLVVETSTNLVLWTPLLTNYVWGGGRFVVTDLGSGNERSRFYRAVAGVTVSGVPPNDEFADRTAIVGTNATVTGSNVNATTEAGEDWWGEGQTVWWTWTAPVDGVVTVDTIGSSFNTLLMVFTGDAVSNLTWVAGDDDSGGGLASMADFFVTAGTTYQIAVDSAYSASPGSIVLNLRYTQPRPSQIILQPQSQTVYVGDWVDLWVGVDGTQPFSFQWRKNGVDLPDQTNGDLWISSVQTDDAGAYDVVVSNYVTSVTSTQAILTVLTSPATNNDAFADRIVITGTNATVTGSNEGATREPGEPDHAGDTGGASVWWTWTAPMDGTVTVDTIGSSFDTLLAVYTGDEVWDLTPVTSDDQSGGDNTSALMFDATSGTTYQIAVDGYQGDSGSIVLHVMEEPNLLQEIYSFPELPIPNSLAKGSDGAFYGTISGGGSGGFGTVFRVATNGTLTTLASFARTNGAHPHGPLVQGTDGAFYGTTSDGGDRDLGTVFRLTTNGLLATLASLNWEVGRYPQAGLVQGSDGAFYGTAQYGGSSYYYGTVFRVTTDGVLTRLASFANTNGAYPSAALVQGSDGALYGTTPYGGVTNRGTVFRVTTNGVLTMLASFVNTNGSYPTAALAWGGDGALYGTAPRGGADSCGTVFRVTTNGMLKNLVSFGYTNGAYPQAGLLPSSNGLLYGTTAAWGDYYSGTLFSVTTNGHLATLASFSYANGSGPNSSLVQGPDGALYGAAPSGGDNNYGTVFRMSADRLLTALVSFTNEEGSSPQAGLVQAADGALYGTTQYGGDTGYGAIFRVMTNGILTTLASFDYDQGAYPAARLTPYGDGALYGTTRDGGDYGAGTVFRITSDGDLTNLASFDYDNGSYPQAGLVLGSDGAFYGTTSQGGSNDLGTVFQVTTNGDLTALVAFAGTNGSYPCAPLLLGSDGAFYGTTANGGANDYGTVFRVTTNGELKTLVSFAVTNGAYPLGGLVQGSDGVLYGTTQGGGTNDYGTVFRITMNGTLTNLLSFGYYNSGASPAAALLLGSDGAFYGTTQQGGVSDYGTVFRITTNGVLTTLGSFNYSNGSMPWTLVQGTDGNLYGTCAEGGSRGGGNVFRIVLTAGVVPPGPLSIRRLGNSVVLSWADPAFTLQASPTVTGTFANVNGVTSPYTNPITGPRKFFRLKAN